jgi:phospholipase C
MKSRRDFIRNAALAVPAVGKAWTRQRAQGPDSRVQRIVVLMLENRSFDHMLGYAFQNDPNVCGFPCNLPTNTDPDGKIVRIEKEDESSGDFYPDPGHDFDDVNLQVFGTCGPPQGLPNMQGFVRSYRCVCDEVQNRRLDGRDPADQSHRIMRAYPSGSLRILETLAREYTVCDNWFCSVPGPTLPNRKFVHAGTSFGQLNLSVAEFDVSPTIYEVLDGDNVSSAIYADGWTAAATFRNLFKYQDRFFGTMDDFFQDCAENRLPAYCFLEPRYASGLTNGVFRPQNDQHPDSDVQAGEDLICSVYTAIRSNPEVWKNTMLVIVYDEHGGLFDHVYPPVTVSPDGRRDNSESLHYFDFDRLGPRVPAVIVSAYIRRNPLHQVFDHTSVIATAQWLLNWKRRDPVLGKRAMCANTFESALNLEEQRSDPPTFDDYRPNRTPRRVKGRRPNDLQLTWKSFAKHVNKQLPCSQKCSINVTDVHTDQDIQRYLEHVYAGVRGVR